MKLKKVLFILLAVVAIGLFVACNDDVMANKDDSLNAYRVVESNGAFVYNGVKYETLQDALDAIENGKTAGPEKVITVTRDVTGPAAKVADGQSVLLDLGGHALTFYGVEQSGLSIGSGTTFGVVNGTLALQDTNNEELAVVYAKDATFLGFLGVAINAKGQNALVADNVSDVFVTCGSAITGDTSVTGGDFFLGSDSEDTSSMNGLTTLSGVNFGSDDSTSVAGEFVASDGSIINVSNNMEAGIELDGSTITVSETGHVVIDKVNGDYQVNAVQESAITNNTGEDITVHTGICMITRDSIPTIYGNLEAALASLDQDDRTIVLIGNEATVYDYALSPNNNYAVSIDLAGFDVKATSATNITSAGAITLKSTSDGAVFGGSVSGTGTDEGTEITVDHVEVDGNVTSAYSVTIRNGSNIGGVTLVDTISAPRVYISNSHIGARLISADGTESNPATSVTILESSGIVRKIFAEAANNTDCAVVLSSTATRELEIGNSEHDDSDTTTHAREYVLKVKTGKIVISGNDSPVRVYENVLVSDGELTTQKAVILGTVEVTGDMTDGLYTPEAETKYSNGSTFGNGIDVSGTGKFYKSVFTPNTEGLTGNVTIEAETVDIGGVLFTSTHYDVEDPTPDYDVCFNVITSGADSAVDTSVVSPLTITSSAGTAGNLSSTGGSIKIDNSAVNTAGYSLTTGAIAAINTTTADTYYDVTVYGPAAESTLTIGSVLYADDVVAKRAVFAGEIGGDTSAHVTTLTDGTYTPAAGETPASYADGSTFKEAITVSGSATFYDSTFTPADANNKLLKAGTVAITESVFNTTSDKVFEIGSEGGNISLVSVTGTTGDIKTTKTDTEATSGVSGTITIDNSAFTSGTGNTLTAGDLYAYLQYGSPLTFVAGDVTVKGGTSDNKVTVDDIAYAKDITTKYAVVTEEVSSEYYPATSLTADYSTFKEDIYSGSVTADHSTLGDSAEDDVFASTIAISNSTLNLGKVMKSYTVYPSDPDVSVAADLIKLTNVSGTLGEAYVAANENVDYTANIVGTDTYYAFYLSNAESTAALDVKNITSAGGTGTKPGDTPVEQTVQAVYVNNSSSNSITSTGVATSVAATSGDVYIGNSGDGTVTVDGIVKTSVSGNIEFKGASEHVVTVNGDVESAGAVTANYTTIKGNVSADTSFTATNSTIGDGTLDVVHSPSITITGASKLILGELSLDTLTKANEIVLNLTNDFNSNVVKINTDKLTVSSVDNKLTVDGTTATGATTINGGRYTGTTNLSGATTINGGVFTGYVTLSGTGANTINGCSFYDDTTYGSFTYSGTGTLSITNGSIDGNSTFSSGTTTITGGYLGSNSSHTAYLASGSTVYINNVGSMHIADASAGTATFKAGSVTVYSTGALSYVGSRISQDDYTQSLSINLGQTISLSSNTSLSSTIKNLGLNLGNYSITTNGKFLLLASSSGTYNVTYGTGRIIGADGSFPSGGVKYHEGVTINCDSGIFTYNAGATTF